MRNWYRVCDRFFEHRLKRVTFARWFKQDVYDDEIISNVWNLWTSRERRFLKDDIKKKVKKKKKTIVNYVVKNQSIV